MFIAIGSALLGLVGKKDGATSKLMRAVGFGAMVLVAVLAFFLWLAIHDSNVADEALDDQDAAINTAVIGADRYAGERKGIRDNEFEASQRDLDSGIGNAVATKPAEVKKPVGPASQSYYDKLREQQKREQR